MRLTIVAGAVLAAFAGSAMAADAQIMAGPTNDKALSFKSQWGKDDRAGSANHTKNPAQIKRALSTIKQNKAITNGKYYHREAPAFGPAAGTCGFPARPPAARSAERAGVSR